MKLFPKTAIRAWLAAGMGWLATGMVWLLMATTGLADGRTWPVTGRRVAVASTVVECLALKPGLPGSTRAMVRLVWEGEVEEAYLVLVVAGSEGEHTIYVNGRPVARAPIYPGGVPCRSGMAVEIPIPPDVLVSGENVIELTNDADRKDSWSAAGLHIEIHGLLSGPPVPLLETPLLSASPPDVGATATGPVSGAVALTSTYELAQGYLVTQVVWYQIPASYTEGVSTPLVVALHGMGGTGEWVRDYLAEEANNRGWLLVAPDMHGRYYVNHGKYALGWVGAQHDVIDTVEYMASHYSVDPRRIYVVGGSMGGQATAMVSAKYPDLFAAAVPWKPLTDLTDWYYEVEALGDPYGDLKHVRRETGGTHAGATPSEAPFEYQRRSPMELLQNNRLVPIKMWHDVDDGYVYIHHSRDLRDAINGWGPPVPVLLIEVPSEANDCPPDDQGRDLEHCYNPAPSDIFDFLDGFTLDTEPPISISVRTDESKPYYWLNVAETGGDHWSEIEATYSPTNRTVLAVVSDTRPLTLAFNLGSTAMPGPGGTSRAGMGLPETTYLIRGGGNYRLETYESGYLTVPTTATGYFTLTISAIDVVLSADPAVVVGGEVATSTITAVVEDRTGAPVPDGTVLVLTTTEGAFPGGGETHTTTIVNGGATALLTLGPTADLARITGQVGAVTGTASVDVIHPALNLQVVPDAPQVYTGERVTLTYRLTNTGDVTLTQVTVVDDNGTPAEGSDDLTACIEAALAVGASVECIRSVTPTQILTLTVVAAAQDPLGGSWTDTDVAVVGVQPRKIYLPVVLSGTGARTQQRGITKRCSGTMKSCVVCGWRQPQESIDPHN